MPSNPSASYSSSPPKAKDTKTDLYIHLANGDVIGISNEEWAAAVAESGSPSVYRKDGIEHPVIGVFYAEVSYMSPEQEK
jgi:hypothetical protein